MKRLGLVGLFVTGLLLGAVAVNWRWSHLLSAQLASKSVEVALGAAQETEWLAQLRLNEPSNVVEQLERSINLKVVTLAQWENAAALDSQSRLARDRFLFAVKVYRRSYAAGGDKAAGIDAAQINALLATVPDRNLKSDCKWGVCRLEELRLHGGQASTNTFLQSPSPPVGAARTAVPPHR